MPGYEFPEDAARAVALAAKYGRWRATPERGRPPIVDARAAEAAGIISRQLASGGGWLSPVGVIALLDCYGLPMIPSRVVSDDDAAVATAAEFGGPVALKASAPGLLHKSDAGGVRLGLEGPAAVRAAANDIEAAVTRAGFRLESLVVQSMAPSGVELIVGMVNDHSFGPVGVRRRWQHRGADPGCGRTHYAADRAGRSGHASVASHLSIARRLPRRSAV